jgi:hypothetical protein
MQMPKKRASRRSITGRTSVAAEEKQIPQPGSSIVAAVNSELTGYRSVRNQGSSLRKSRRGKGRDRSPVGGTDILDACRKQSPPSLFEYITGDSIFGKHLSGSQDKAL